MLYEMLCDATGRVGPWHAKALSLNICYLVSWSVSLPSIFDAMSRCLPAHRDHDKSRFILLLPLTSHFFLNLWLACARLSGFAESPKGLKGASDRSPQKVELLQNEMTLFFVFKSVDGIYFKHLSKFNIAYSARNRV